MRILLDFLVVLGRLIGTILWVIIVPFYKGTYWLKSLKTSVEIKQEEMLSKLMTPPEKIKASVTRKPRKVSTVKKSDVVSKKEKK